MLIPLSPMDYYFLRRSLYTIQMIFPFEGRIDAERLSAALRATLPSFPALHARLELLSSTEAGLRVMPEPGELPLRIRTQASDYDAFSPEDSVINAPGEPLLKLTLVSTPGGSTLAMSLSHLVGDGYSYFRFLTSLADAFHGRPVTAPSNFRQALHFELPDRAEPVSSARLFRTTGYIYPRPPSPAQTQSGRFHLSASELKELKREANSAARDLTLNHVVMAELLRRFQESIPLHRGRLIVRCPVDYRRSYPILRDLPADYFGNAVCDAVASFDPAAFRKLSLGEIASRIRHSIRQVQPASIQAQLATLRDLLLQDGHAVFEQLGCPGLLVSNLTRVPLAKLDFGAGPPRGIQRASMNPRLVALFAAADGLDVHYQLPLGTVGLSTASPNRHETEQASMRDKV